jgi:uncharacterized protein (DUF305 family)
MVRRPWAVLLALALAAGCGQPAPTPAAPPQAGVATPPVTGFNGTDIAWLQLMIPMNEQALRLLELVPARHPAPETRQLAELVGAGYRTELDQLRTLRTQAAVPATNLHEGHDMPGLMTADELHAAGNARGAALDRLVAAQLRENFQQSILLCHGERTSGAHRATKALAAAIERARAARLAQLAARAGTPRSSAR